MNPTILNYLQNNRIGVVSVLLNDNSIHSATVQYSYSDNPFKIYIQTSNDTEKVKSLSNNESVKASFVIGFSEIDWITFQLRGDIRIVKDQNELESIYKIHYSRLIDAEKRKGPKTVFLEFTANWWRYSDMKLKQIIKS